MSRKSPHRFTDRSGRNLCDRCNEWRGAKQHGSVPCAHEWVENDQWNGGASPYPILQCGRCNEVVNPFATGAVQLADRLKTFAQLLEAEWYNGNLTESAYERLNADLHGILAEYRQTTLVPA